MASEQMQAFLDAMGDQPKQKDNRTIEEQRAGLDDSTSLEDRAAEAGVPVDIRLFDEAFHVFQIFTEFPESQEALSDIGRFFDLHIR